MWPGASHGFHSVPRAHLCQPGCPTSGAPRQAGLWPQRTAAPHTQRCCHQPAAPLASVPGRLLLTCLTARGSRSPHAFGPCVPTCRQLSHAAHGHTAPRGHVCREAAPGWLRNVGQEPWTAAGLLPSVEKLRWTRGSIFNPSPLLTAVRWRAGRMRWCQQMALVTAAVAPVTRGALPPEPSTQGRAHCWGPRAHCLPVFPQREVTVRRPPQHSECC